MCPDDSNFQFHLASGGGDATAKGIQFQGTIGATYLASILGELPLDPRLSLGGPLVRWVRFETEAPVDDVLIATSQGGYIAIQAKTTVSISDSAGSPFYKTVEQIVRHWLYCRAGCGERGWDRRLNAAHDRFVIAVSQDCTAPVKTHLAAALDRTREPSTPVPLIDAQVAAIDRFRTCIKTCWSTLSNEELTSEITAEICRLTKVITYDFDGGHWAATTSQLAGVLADPSQASNVMAALRDLALSAMRGRNGLDKDILRRAVSDRGIRLKVPTEYQTDVAQLKKYGGEVHKLLGQYQKISTTADGELTIPRASKKAIFESALAGSLLIIGEPGAGKSAAINDLATDLSDAGHDVVQLAVDRLHVDSLNGLDSQLGIKHPLLDVLDNWDGGAKGYVLIDALDASRGGVSESVFRTLIELIIQRDSRWQVIASIRSFDLRLGTKFKTLFRGKPPNNDLSDKGFLNVRHIRVPVWGASELEYLYANAPTLGNILKSLSPKLQSIAHVPFNTRLIADLATSGLAVGSFASVHSQVELLSLYWEHRVGEGAEADLCLKRIVSQMLAKHELRAEKMEILESDVAKELNRLQEEGVLIQSENGRYLSFRHHILFDYAASRVYLSPDQLAGDSAQFNKRDGLGLMLAPALTFVLRESWLSDSAHKAFWKGVVNLLKQTDADPVLKSVASRVCAELTKVPLDIAVLLELLKAERQSTLNALAHIFGAIAVRAEDKEPVECEAWAFFALGMANAGLCDASIWSLRTLLYLLVERTTEADQRNQLGIAARTLLEYGFDKTSGSGITDSGITFVAETFGTDIESSKKLLRRMFDEARFSEHAHNDVPSLAYRIEKVIPLDPEFGVEIYEGVYGRGIEVSIETSMSKSQILPLTTNSRQDYGMARYSLKEYFPKYLSDFPLVAARALVAAARGYVAREHSSTDRKVFEVTVAGRKARIVEDHSYIWASDPEGPYAQDAEELVLPFTKFLRECPINLAEQVADVLIDENQTSWLWARLFLVASTRPELAQKLWPFASQTAFILNADTLKDAIDVVAAAYSYRTVDERRLFETSILKLDYSHYTEPEAAKQRIISRIAIAVGEQDPSQLVTEELKSCLAASGEGAVEKGNDRLYSIRSFSSAAEDYFWLDDKDKLKEPPNNSLVIAINEAKLLSKGEKGKSLGLIEGMAQVRSFRKSIDLAKVADGVSRGLLSHAEGVLADACETLTKMPGFEAAEYRDFGAEIADVVEQYLLHSPSPELHDDTEANFERSASWGSPAARLSAAEVTLDLANSHRELYPRLKPFIAQFLSDRHPAVRMVASSKLIRLWEVDNDGMWAFAEEVVKRERNAGVLQFFSGSFLNTSLHHAPDKVEPLYLKLYEEALLRRPKDEDETPKELLRNIGSSLLMLAISHKKVASARIVERFLDDPVTYQSTLNECIFSVRSGLILGFGTDDEAQHEIRKGCQSFVHRCVEIFSARVRPFLEKMEKGNLSEVEATEAKVYVALIDQVCSQLFFAAGASENRNDGGLLGPEHRAQYLDEIESTIRIIGDVGSPHTIYYLLQLLEYLTPSQPEKAFDLIAHALLTGGKKYGYHHESLAADLMVRMIGQLLADHREIFEDNDRRQHLIECLEIFLSAGWPSARRLLYHLPELLQ